MIWVAWVAKGAIVKANTKAPATIEANLAVMEKRVMAGLLRFDLVVTGAASALTMDRPYPPPRGAAVTDGTPCTDDARRLGGGRGGWGGGGIGEGRLGPRNQRLGGLSRLSPMRIGREALHGADRLTVLVAVEQRIAIA